MEIRDAILKRNEIHTLASGKYRMRSKEYLQGSGNRADYRRCKEGERRKT